MEEADPALFLRLPRIFWAMFRCSKRMKRARREAKRAFEEDVLPKYLDYLKELDVGTWSGTPKTSGRRSGLSPRHRDAIRARLAGLPPASARR